MNREELTDAITQALRTSPRVLVMSVRLPTQLEWPIASAVTEELWPVLAKVWANGFHEGECYAGLFKPGDKEPQNPYK